MKKTPRPQTHSTDQMGDEMHARKVMAGSDRLTIVWTKVTRPLLTTKKKEKVPQVAGADTSHTGKGSEETDETVLTMASTKTVLLQLITNLALLGFKLDSNTNLVLRPHSCVRTYCTIP